MSYYVISWYYTQLLTSNEQIWTRIKVTIVSWQRETNVEISKLALLLASLSQASSANRGPLMSEGLRKRQAYSYAGSRKLAGAMHYYGDL